MTIDHGDETRGAGPSETGGRADRGNALIAALVIAMALMAIAALMMSTLHAGSQERVSSLDHMKRLYAAEAGVAMAMSDISSGGDGNLGAATTPRVASGAGYWTTAIENGDGTFTIVSFGSVRGRERSIEATVLESPMVFDHALFAGNASGDPAYAIEFGGTGVEADVINGSVYSGNDVVVSGDAAVTGEIRATGDITGAVGETGVTQPIPDIAAENYEIQHDFNVAELFSAATYESDDAGGSAWQVPEANPAHIFRRNPSDRTSEIDSTVKDDYFIEDPYEPVTADAGQDNTDPYLISLPGPAQVPGDESQGLDMVYYIDGNLWFHNIPTYSFKFQTQTGHGIHVTFVVKGNIYISDNLFYDNPDLDGVALVAIKDEAHADSGNIYFGDPRGGTLVYMDSFMYAENDFYDLNLGAVGSTDVTLNGTMAAGNAVSIDRDFADHHARFALNHDTRLRDGVIQIPGVPGQAHAMRYALVAWREITHD